MTICQKQMQKNKMLKQHFQKICIYLFVRLFIFFNFKYIFFIYYLNNHII